jgi:hypothetical protein
MYCLVYVTTPPPPSCIPCFLPPAPCFRPHLCSKEEWQPVVQLGCTWPQHPPKR